MTTLGTVLVTNDDGIDSPALVPFVRALATIAERVRVVVPDGERSWSSKGVTRTTSVDVVATTRGGHAMHAVQGTPADATQVGCSAAWPDGPPDLVVAGINLGHNHGQAFALSSGTIGAAVEGVLLGHRAVAVSTGTMADDYRGWTDRVWSAGARPDWDRLAELARDVLVDVVASELFATTPLVSVNLPWSADRDTPRRVTRLASTRYGPMLAAPDRPDPGAAPVGAWRPTYGGLVVPEPGPHARVTDLQAADARMVSITPLHLAVDVAVADVDVERLERGTGSP